MQLVCFFNIATKQNYTLIALGDVDKHMKLRYLSQSIHLLQHDKEKYQINRYNLGQNIWNKVNKRAKLDRSRTL